MNRAAVRAFALAVVISHLVTGLVYAHSSRSKSAQQLAETYVDATIDANGRLRIVTAGGKVIQPARLPARANIGDQVGVEDVAISPDGRSVGWLALYPNCCTSYPIPLALVLYSKGRTRTFTGNELPVWRWGFDAGGSQVAFEQETVHGATGIHYELRDIASGRLVDKYDPVEGPKPSRERTPDLRDVPRWVAQLDAEAAAPK